MPSKTNVNTKRSQKLKLDQGEWPNWVLIAGGALLSTLSIRLGCTLKQAFHAKRSNSAIDATKGISDSAVDINHQPTNPATKDAVDLSLPLVKTPGAMATRENGGVMWASSPDRLELPPKPFHHSNSSDSLCMSESGSDIYSKREVIQKLRQQLKRRDEMIMEMQTQIMELQSTLNVQMTHSGHLQSQLDSANQDLFGSEREIQRLRKAIADHCIAEAVCSEKPVITRNWRPEAAMNGQVNGCLDSVDDVELHCVGREKLRGERVDMLRREVEELKEVIEGKEMLLQSYKEQKVELSSKVKELQLRLASQVPNIL